MKTNPSKEQGREMKSRAVAAGVPIINDGAYGAAIAQMRGMLRICAFALPRACRAAARRLKRIAQL